MRARLAAFKAEHSHCRVHVKYPADFKLGMWVTKQVIKQREFTRKKLATSHPSPRVTAERVAKLEALGFELVPPSMRMAGASTLGCSAAIGVLSEAWVRPAWVRPAAAVRRSRLSAASIGRH